MDPATHVARFSDFALAYDAMNLLVRHGYRELQGSLERLMPKTARIVPGKAFGYRVGRSLFVGWIRTTMAESRIAEVLRLSAAE